MFARNSRGERRASPGVYKFLLTAHIIVSVGWLGVVIAKVVLGIVGLLADSAADTALLYDAMETLSFAFPPLAIGTLVTGVLLSLGTKWGLIDHYWVATKIVLTVGIVGTAVQIGSRLTQRRLAALSGQTTVNGSLLDLLSAPVGLVLALTMAHLLMLVIATILSTYKPWGKTWFGRRATLRQSAGRATLATQRAGERG